MTGSVAIGHPEFIPELAGEVTSAAPRQHPADAHFRDGGAVAGDLGPAGEAHDLGAGVDLGALDEHVGHLTRVEQVAAFFWG